MLSRLFTCSVALLLVAGGARFVRAETPPLARFAPADAGLYVEIRRSEDVLVALTEPQLWSALAEMVGQPAGADDAEQWRQRVRQAIGMEPAEAIVKLFAGGVAFVGEGPLRSQDAVVLCRPAADVVVGDLLTSWGAQSLNDGELPGAFRLAGNVGVAMHDGVLIFGDTTPSRDLLRRTLRLARATPPVVLADDRALRALLERVPVNPDGILFARLAQGRSPILLPPRAPAKPPSTQPTTAAATQPTTTDETLPAIIPDLPGPLRGAAHVLLALHRDGRLLHFTAVGDAPPAGGAARNHLAALVQALPEQTLAAWGGHVDYAALRQAVESLPPTHMARVVLRLQDQSAALLPQILDSPTAAAVGFVRQATAAPGTPPLPAVALLVTVRDAQAAATAVSDLAATSSSVYNLLALQQGLPALPPVADVALDGVTARQLDLSNLVAEATGRTVAELHLCWALDGDVLIIASHRDWLRQVLASRRGAAPTLAAAMARTGRTPPEFSETIVVAQLGPSADLGAAWLARLEQVAPASLQEEWWRSRQPGGGRVQLGIRVAEETEQRRLRVVSVGEQVPASGLLRPGDLIIGGEGRVFVTERPLVEIQAVLENRTHARWVDLTVEREGTALPVRIPLPFVDPVRVLQRWVAIGRLVQRVVYCDEVPVAAAARGLLTLELRDTPAPLFDLSPTAAPTTQPTTAPRGE